MSDHKNHITNLTPELMQQYQNGTLSSEMQHQVERYLLDHPFEAEAMEGMQLGGVADFWGDVSNLKSLLNTSKKKEKVILLWQQYWKVAAVITLLVVSTFLVLELNRTSELAQNELALNEEVESENEQDLKEAVPIIEKDNELVPENSSDQEVFKETPAGIEYSEGLEEERAIELAEEVTESAELDDQLIAKTTNEEMVADEPINTDERFDVVEIAEENQLALVSKSKEARKGMSASGAPLSNSDQLTKDLEDASRIITGKIVSAEDGTPLPGVNVVVVGTTKGTITDLAGNYELVLPAGKEVISYSFIGYQGEEVTIGESEVLDLSLPADVSALSEVVITATGVERTSKSLGYAVSEVKRKKSNKKSAFPIGGFDEFETYLKSSLQYPKEAIENDIAGTVVLEFLVDKNSELVDFEVTKGLGSGCSEEAIRLIEEGPAWQSATNKRGDNVGEKVKVKVIFEQ